VESAASSPNGFAHSHGVARQDRTQELSPNFGDGRDQACRVAVVAPSTKRRHGAVYHINIWVTIPPHENIAVSHQPSDYRSHAHVEVAIKDAFATARRQIEALAQRASGEVELHEVDPPRPGLLVFGLS